MRRWKNVETFLENILRSFYLKLSSARGVYILVGYTGGGGQIIRLFKSYREIGIFGDCV